MKKFLKMIYDSFIEARTQVILHRRNRPYL